MSQIQYNFKKNDEYYTPAYAVEPIVKYIKPHSTIWCPFDKADSQFVKVFQQNGFNVIFLLQCKAEILGVCNGQQNARPVESGNPLPTL